MTHLQKQIHKTITGRGKAGWNMFRHPEFKNLLDLDYRVAKWKDQLLSESILYKVKV